MEPTSWALAPWVEKSGSPARHTEQASAAGARNQTERNRSAETAPPKLRCMKVSRRTRSRTQQRPGASRPEILIDDSGSTGSGGAGDRIGQRGARARL